MPLEICILGVPLWFCLGRTQTWRPKEEIKRQGLLDPKWPKCNSKSPAVEDCRCSYDLRFAFVAEGIELPGTNAWVNKYVPGCHVILRSEWMGMCQDRGTRKIVGFRLVSRLSQKGIFRDVSVLLTEEMPGLLVQSIPPKRVLKKRPHRPTHRHIAPSPSSASSFPKHAKAAISCQGPAKVSNLFLEMSRLAKAGNLAPARELGCSTKELL